MAKVIEFPIKKVTLPHEVEECLYEIAKAYVKIVNYALTECSSDRPTDAELSKIHDEVISVYSDGLDKAVIEMEKDLSH